MALSSCNNLDDR